jgi:hypothetical protein
MAGGRTLRQLRRAADQGVADAQLELGQRYEEGGFDSQDLAEAARLWRLAAAQGDAQAQHNLAISYLEGRGVSLDPAEGARLYRLAAASLSYLLLASAWPPSDSDGIRARGIKFAMHESNPFRRATISRRTAGTTMRTGRCPRAC